MSNITPIDNPDKNLPKKGSKTRMASSKWIYFKNTSESHDGRNHSQEVTSRGFGFVVAVPHYQALQVDHGGS